MEEILYQDDNKIDLDYFLDLFQRYGRENLKADDNDSCTICIKF